MLVSALLVALLLPAKEPKFATFFIGTYTSANGSQGIYEAKLNLKTGAISMPVLVAKTNNPSYLAVSPNSKNLYAVDESGEGSVSAYEIEESKLNCLNRQSVEGPSPCYLSVDPRGRNVLVASYGSGIVSCFPLAGDGTLQKVAGVAVDYGSGPNLDRQDGPHMHWVQADVSSRWIYTCDLGTDKVQAFPLDSLTGRISPSLQPDIKVPSGSGPRHGAWGPHGNFLYVANEMGSSVSVLRVDPSSGRLSLIQTISSLEADPALSHNTAAEIVCGPSGKAIYVSNRGDDSVATFLILQSGELKRIQVKHLKAKVPRGFGIDPTGKWLIAAGQESNNLECLPIERDGKLGETACTTTLSKPTCVVFWK